MITRKEKHQIITNTALNLWWKEVYLLEYPWLTFSIRSRRNINKRYYRMKKNLNKNLHRKLSYCNKSVDRAIVKYFGES